MRLSPVLAGLLLALLWTPQSTAAEYVDIREWDVPWSKSGPRDPFVEPSGGASQPYGMAIDRNDRLWLVETGVAPNRFVGFDTASEEFVSGTDIPSGGGRIRHMYYLGPTGEIWFGTDTNNVGRAKVH